MNQEMNYETTVEKAKPIKEMAEISRTLDVEYLEECLKQMKDAHSYRESASILDPRPQTVFERQDLERAKIKGLELMIALSKNQTEIFDATIKLGKAEANSHKLERFFGL